MLELNPLDYTVAWIAPLQIELEAALAALDKVHHGEFPHRPGDEHIFEAGEIESHNVVIGTIPASASYGTSAAVSLANELRRTFPNIRLTLVVGIAAAFPELPVRDIRLGDILVGLSDRNESAIVQYDLGKQTSDGFQLLRGGHALQPASKLASMALAKAERKARQNPDYFLQQYKTVRDGRHGGITFPDPGQETDHFYVVNSEGQECIANREPRPPEERTRVWKGVLGSGNTLLKDERGRHELQVRYKVIGVEMEAAGVLTELPAGVIRGVSDYGDKYKNDKWQLYAAAQAAAFAKLTLMSTPESRPYTSHHSRGDGHAAESDTMSERRSSNGKGTRYLSDDERRKLHKSLGYDSILALGSHIESEDQGTCQWLLEKPEFRKWLEEDQSPEDFLWIKGKPGTGKSTLMKAAFENADGGREEREGNKRKKRIHENTEHIIIPFFFYGRGTDSQKSMEALYRSLLVQLLDKHLPSADKVFKSQCKEVTYGEEPKWDEKSLKNVLEKVLLSLEQYFVSIFIDALDECVPPKVQDMFNYFNKINKKGRAKGIIIRFLLASRPYPAAKCENCVEIDLISQAGHREDMETWVKSGLRCLGSSRHARKIREKLIQKASGVFLWAVLVAKEIEKKNLAWDLNKVEAELQSLPAELKDLFERIVERDSIDQEKLILCLQWVLVARQQPLDARQLEAAIRFGADRERPTLTAQLEMEDEDEEDGFMANAYTEDTEMEDIQNGNVQGSHMNYTQSVDTDMYGTDTHMQDTGIYGTFTNMPGPGINGTGINGTNTHMQGTGMHDTVTKSMPVRNKSMENMDEDLEATRGYLLACSKGFIEISKSKKNPSVQFIHHSVREFLFDGGLGTIRPELRKNLEGISHDTLKRYCEAYIQEHAPLIDRLIVEGNAKNDGLVSARERATKKLVLLRYAVNNVLYHADMAEKFGIDQRLFLQEFPRANWIKQHNFLESRKSRRHNSNARLIYILSERNAANLIKLHPDKADCFVQGEERYGIPLLAAVLTGSREARVVLMKAYADSRPGNPQLQNVCEEFEDFKGSGNGMETPILSSNSMLCNVVKAGDRSALHFAFAAGYSAGTEGTKLLKHAICYRGDPAIPRILLTHGVDVEGDTKSFQAFQEHLLDPTSMPGDINWGNKYHEPLLPLAAKMNRTGMIRSLLEVGADTARTDGAGYTPLMYAAQNGQEEVVTQLLAHNAQVDFCTEEDCKTALSCAVDASNHGVAKLLLSRGANIEAPCAHGKTPLAAAREREDRSMIDFLLEHGVGWPET